MERYDQSRPHSGLTGFRPVRRFDTRGERPLACYVTAPPTRWKRMLVPGLGLSVLYLTALLAMEASLALAASEPSAPTPGPGGAPAVGAAGAATDPATTQAPSPRVTGMVLDVGPTPSPTPSPTPARPTPPDQLSGYIWPIDIQNQASITTMFGPNKDGEFLVDGQLFHDGIDLATQCGDKIHAAHDGVVVAAGRDYVRGMGWRGDVSVFRKRFSQPKLAVNLPIVIIVDDGNGYRSIYGHESKVTVKVGQHVSAGEVIGYEGATGNATGCHLHFGMFSPLETATFGNLPEHIARPAQLPARITARIDPLLVLPYRNDFPKMRKLRPADAAAWAAARAPRTPEPPASSPSASGS